MPAEARLALAGLRDKLSSEILVQREGAVTDVSGLVIQTRGPAASIGEICSLRRRSDGSSVDCEVVGFKGSNVMMMPIGEMAGISAGDIVRATGHPFRVPVGPSLIGRVVSAWGSPLDSLGPIHTSQDAAIAQAAPHALKRQRISQPITTGVRAIDGMLTLGRGQRVGIFSGSGTGKSTLLSMMARNTDAELSVIALVGERGREVLDFIERDLGPEGLARSIVVVATSEEPPLVRRQAAFTATTIAEYFRDQGKHVLLMMDSVTRFAMAQREIGLSTGEPPATKGYPPSTFALLPKLLERAGTGTEKGSITGLYTVLVEADDLNEPISDTVRAILDGHIVLSRDLASRGHFPPVDVLASVSRLMLDIVEPEHLKWAKDVRMLLAEYSQAEDLINVGAYVKGSNPKIDRAISAIDLINAFLISGIKEKTSLEDAKAGLKKIIEALPKPEVPQNG